MLALIKYLSEHFYTKQELLDVSKITSQELLEYQEKGVMTKSSYKLTINLTSDSVFGLHNEEEYIEYYAKGYSSWLGIIQTLKSPEEIYSLFSERYKIAVNRLKEEGHTSDDPKVTSEFNQHIKEEWSHFINGVYGLCTRSGLPEDIAGKELAILQIKIS